LVKADIVSYFFNLRSPEWMWAWHAMPEVLVADLLEAGLSPEELDALSVGCRGTDETRIFPTMASYPMGYLHSQFVAQHVHQKVVNDETFLSPDMQITDDDPMPEGDCYGTVCDDLFAFLHDLEKAKLLDGQLTKAYIGAGLERNLKKSVSGKLRGDVLGLDFVGTGRVAPFGSKALRLLRAPVELVARERGSPWLVSKVTGNWTWPMLLRRCALSAFDKVYAFAESNSRFPVFLPAGIREEYLIACCLLPALEGDLTLPWSTVVGATDASLEGFGGVHVEMTERQVRVLSRLSETKGDYVVLQEPHLDEVGGILRLSEPKKRRGTPHLLDLRQEQ
jgi:hypothetical protein